VVGYAPFSLCAIHKESLCPSSGNINRLMMMMMMKGSLSTYIGIQKFQFFCTVYMYSQQYVRLYKTVKLHQYIFNVIQFTIKHRFDWEYLTVSTNLSCCCPYCIIMIETSLFRHFTEKNMEIVVILDIGLISKLDSFYMRSSMVERSVSSTCDRRS
jgi:hypothetical protein